MRLSYLCAMAAAIALALGLSVDARAANLGAANDYNAFIFGNHDANGGDTEGRLAVGGNLLAFSYSVGGGGDGRPGAPLTTPRTDVLVVGQTMETGNWQVYNGNAVYGTNIIGGPTVNSGTTRQQANLIDFASAKTNLLAMSASLATLPANGTSLKPYSTLELVGTNPTLNVFNVTEAFWESSVDKQITIPNGSTAIINIAGVAVSQSGGMAVNGSANQTTSPSEKILFNYYQATSLTHTNMALLGSVLAPQAHLDLLGGGLNGVSVVASAYQRGGGEFHNRPFTGDIPYTPVVPEPTSLALAGLGLAAIAVKRHRS